MKYKISIVEPHLIPDVWPKVEGFLQQVCDITDGRSTPAETLNSVIKDLASLWVVYDEATLQVVGALVVKINQYPKIKLLTVEQLAGEDFDEWIDQANELLIICAKHYQCAGLELIGRRGWVKKLSRLHWKERFSTCQLLFEEQNG